MVGSLQLLGDPANLSGPLGSYGLGVRTLGIRGQEFGGVGLQVLGVKGLGVC